LEEAVRHGLGTLEAAATATPLADRPGVSPSGAAPAVPAAAWLPFDQAEPPPTSAGSLPFERAAGRPILQLLDTYLVFESTEGVVFVDQHSAHERVIYETVMREIAAGHVASQRLLLPLTIELTDEELDVVERFGEELSRVGFEVEGFGGRTVALQAVPTPHPRFDAAACFRELVADLARGRFGGWANRLERFAATYACRAAVKAGMPLSEPEARALLLRLFETELPPHDVHGRSTIVTLATDELERRFGRR
jgi:DNA mismatch repair protein MutL